MRVCKLVVVFLLWASPAFAFAPKYIVVHITDTRLDYTLEMCNTGHRNNGWDSCGYNWLIYRDGTIVESRGHRQGAHAAGHNAESYGVGLVGKNNVTPAQLEAFRKLHAALGYLPLVPHSQLNKHKTCPTDTVWQLIEGGQYVRGRRYHLV